ncbi:hypothetical protein HZ326_27187 [Fusarium oxysporum f. sp. albedinis]|nr:hypothetical protein HZ326_27187 [Fusarium oxysporum f. sp. albedinis]
MEMVAADKILLAILCYVVPCVTLDHLPILIGWHAPFVPRSRTNTHLLALYPTRRRMADMLVQVVASPPFQRRPRVGGTMPLWYGIAPDD